MSVSNSAKAAFVGARYTTPSLEQKTDKKVNSVRSRKNANHKQKEKGAFHDDFMKCPKYLVRIIEL
ncbi:MAG: hypothetical protein C4522_13655 [Desulfobacteraceae bacterium]|nr:MAG: hypothetical protein C4522_13655 [Desulfobacteraceae bacterium]